MNSRIQQRKNRQRKNKPKKYTRFFLFSLLLLLTAVSLTIFLIKAPKPALIGQEKIVLTTNEPYHDPGIVDKKTGARLPATGYAQTGYVDTSKPGDYQLNYTVSYFGWKQKISRNIKVKGKAETDSPTQPFDLILNGEPEMTLYQGMPYEEPGAQITGADVAQLQNQLQISGEVDVNTPGTYQVNYLWKAPSGEELTKTRTIHVASGRIYLTFDDGPNDETTPQFLATLQEENIKGTFFVTGNGSDEMLKRVHEAGHTIGLHTYTHDYASVYQSMDAYYADLNQVSERVKRVTGVDSKLIRFPGGSSNGISANYTPGIMTTLVSDVVAKGYQYFDWNVSSGDGSNQESSDIPYQNVTSHLQPGQDNIVLMHDTKQTSADALKRIIQYGKENGYVFEALTIDSFPAHHGVTN